MSEYNYRMPAAAGVQAGRRFFNVSVPMRVLTKLLRIDGGAIEERSQRVVNDQRANKVAQYMMSNESSFIIPCLTGVVEVEKGGEEPHFEGVGEHGLVGELVIPMDCTIKLFDGQHRATGIAKAVKEKPEVFAGQNVPVMLFVDMTLAERRLAFTDINQNVSKPAQSISDAFNTRDALPAFAVEIANELNCFKGLVDFERNTIAKNSPCLFPLKALKEATATMIGCGKNPKEITEDQKQFARGAWTALADAMKWGGEHMGDTEAPAFREQNIKTHVVMLKAMAVAVNHIAANQPEGLDLSGLSHLNFSRNSQDFMRRCIQPETGRMTSDATAIQLTANKLIQAAGVVMDFHARDVEEKFFAAQEASKAATTSCWEMMHGACAEHFIFVTDAMLEEMEENMSDVLAENGLPKIVEVGSKAWALFNAFVAGSVEARLSEDKEETESALIKMLSNRRRLRAEVKQHLSNEEVAA